LGPAPMGIYDRDYYRKEGPSYLDRMIPSGIVCKWLIGICIAIYIVQLMTRAQVNMGPVTDYLELDTAKVPEGQIWRLLTYAFLHSPQDPLHIVFNLLFLWWFGSEIETLYGSREFLAFYLVSALVGGIAFQAQAMAMGHPMLCLGASGAVTAVLVLYAFHFPNRLIYVFLVLPVPIWLFVVFQVANDSFHLLVHPEYPIAVSVHLGGAAFATLYYFQHWRILSFLPGVRSWRRQRSRPRLRVYRPQEEPVSVGAPKGGNLDEHLDAKLDAVLEKLSRHGRDSLTDSEKEILQRASEIYKKKRT